MQIKYVSQRRLGKNYMGAYLRRWKGLPPEIWVLKTMKGKKEEKLIIIHEKLHHYLPFIPESIIDFIAMRIVGCRSTRC